MKKPIVFVTALLVLAALTFKAHAQGGEYFTNGKGQAFTNEKRANVEGSPYLTEKWLPGKAQTTGGKIYDNLKLKYDINEDYVIFVYDTAEEPLKFSEEIKSFVIYAPEQMLFANGFPAIGAQSHQSYYRVLSAGDVKFLKHYAKTINEAKQYQATAVVRTYQEVNTYYTFKNGKMEKVDNPKKAAYAIMGDKKAQLDEFVKSNSLNWKKDEDLGKIFDFCNAQIAKS